MTSSRSRRRCATLLALIALAGAPSAAASPSQDLRSPDARAAATGYDPEPVTVAAPEASDSGNGFDWISAAIGGAAVGGLILLLAGFSNGRGEHGVERRRRAGRPVT
jgi:hypothetical protein